MSNQNPKSDEMLKSYVAQIASQGVAIFLQQRQEAEDERIDHAETENELWSRIQWLTDKCEEFEATIDEQNESYASLKELHANVAKDRDKYQQWFYRSLSDADKLKKELAELKEKHPRTDDPLADLVAIARGSQDEIEKGASA